jgi:hypothetical protein
MSLRPDWKDAAYVKRREHALRWRYVFDDAIAEAARGKTEQLQKYLLSDAPLNSEHREALATLIDRRIQLKERGRPPGADPSPRARAKQYVVSAVRRLEMQWRKAHPNKSLPRGMRDELIDRVCGPLGDEGFFYGLVEINKREIHEALARGKKRKAKSAAVC